MILKKSGKVRKCLAWILSVLVVFLSVPFTASSANGAEIKKRVITGIAGYQNDDTPIVTIPAAAGTAYNDLGLPDKLIVKYGTASASDASSSDATKADAEQTLGTGIVIDMATASDLTAAEDDSYAVTALKKEASSMSAALKSGEYLAKIPVTWNIVSGVYGDSAGKWDFKAECRTLKTSQIILLEITN
jgi:hypothetical protein